LINQAAISTPVMSSTLLNMAQMSDRPSTKVQNPTGRTNNAKYV